MNLRNIVGTPLGRDGVHSTDKKFTIVRRSMLRRRCGLVMDENMFKKIF